VREAVTQPTPARRRATRVAVDPAAARWAAVDPAAARSRWIEAFYIAEAKAQLDHQRARNRRRPR